MTAKARKVKKSEYNTTERAVVRKSSMDIGFLATVITLVILGLIMVFSASYPSANFRYGDGLYFIRKQAGWALLGAAAMFGTSKIDYRIYKKLVVPFMIATAVMLLVVLFSAPVNGSRRWLNIGITTFQPSEFAKIAIIISTAELFDKEKKKQSDKKSRIIYFLFVIGTLMLLVAEPHLSVCIIIFLTLTIMFYVGGISGKLIASVFLIAGVMFVILSLKEGYRASRIASWIDPFADKQGDGWQIVQSLYAIASGGFFGLGFGNSRQKFMYVSEPQNDYIFSIICEEMGLIGAFVIIILFVVLIWRGVKIAVNAPDNFGTMLVAGIISLVGVQTFCNIAVVSNMMPSTGISLPFFSAGGTSLLILMSAMGIVLNVSKHERHIISVH